MLAADGLQDCSDSTAAHLTVQMAELETSSKRLVQPLPATGFYQTLQKSKAYYCGEVSREPGQLEPALHRKANSPEDDL
jgi:hypothetical protein